MIGRAGELGTVNVLMALLAFTRGRPEISIRQFRAQVRGLVAIDTADRAMRTHQGKLCLGMVELGEVFPSLGVMADLAAERLAICTGLRHAIFELTLVGIKVTTFAIQVFPLVWDLRLGKR